MASTTGSLASAGSGEATGITGVRLNGSSTAGRPEVFSSADSRLGTVFSQGGATSLTEASTLEPLTAAANSGWSFDCVSGVANNHAAVSTTTSCTPTPMIESTVRIVRLWIAPRTARPSTTPATSPTTTSARIRNNAANSLARGAAMWVTMCGASSTPAIAPSSTPTNESSEPNAPERQPEIAAMKATAKTATSSHWDGVIEFIARRPAAPTSTIASSSSRMSLVSQGLAQPATSSTAEITWPVNPHTSIWFNRNAGPAQRWPRSPR